MSNINCELCLKDFKYKNTFKNHLVRTHSNDFEDKYELELFYLNKIHNITKLQAEEICKSYIDGYSFKDLQDKYKFDAHVLIVSRGIKLRNNSESKKTQIYTNKYKNTIINRYGVDNISKSKEIKEQKEATFLEHFGYKNNFGNKEIRKKLEETLSKRTKEQKQKTKEKYVKTCIEKYGVDNVIKFLEIRNKISNIQKERFSKISKEDRKLLMKIPREALFKSCNAYRSNKEIMIENIIKENNINYKTGGIVQHRSFDFIFEDKKVILEIQGDYFHANPLRYKPNDYFKMSKLTAQQIWDKDLKKKIIAEKYGYKIYYLWESQINKMNSEEILKFVQNILENKNENRN